MKTSKKFLITFITLSLLSSPALAERSPRAGAADARVKTLTYSENDVYRLRGHYGFTTAIEFSPKEWVETVTIGDSEAWQIQPAESRGNILNLKPLLQNAETNMTVLTSKRIYTFELGASEAVSANSRDLTFRVKFRYPDEEDLELADIGKNNGKPFDPFANSYPGSWNFDYSYSGSKSLRPKRVFDDGTFTYFEFNKSDVTPAIFSVDEDGNESLVNFNIEGAYMIANTTGRQFTLRNGDAATCIFKEAFPKDGGKERKIVPLTQLQENPRSKNRPDQTEKTDMASAGSPPGFTILGYPVRSKSNKTFNE